MFLLIEVFQLGPFFIFIKKIFVSIHESLVEQIVNLFELDFTTFGFCAPNNLRIVFGSTVQKSKHRMSAHGSWLWHESIFIIWFLIHWTYCWFQKTFKINESCCFNFDCGRVLWVFSLSLYLALACRGCWGRFGYITFYYIVSYRIVLYCMNEDAVYDDDVHFWINK
jgi:hypothetical protein